MLGAGNQFPLLQLSFTIATSFHQNAYFTELEEHHAVKMTTTQ